MKINKPFILLIAILLPLLLSLTACQSEEKPIHYGGQLYAEEFLLQGLDVWSTYNLSVEHVLFANPDDLLEAFKNGVADIALFSDIQTAQIFNEMEDEALIIAVSESGDRITTVVRADSEIENWSDLSGKRVALRVGSGAELAMKRYFILHQDLDWEDFEWVNLAVDEMPEALAAGEIDAITAIEPIPAMAKASGGMRDLMSYGDCCPAPILLVTTREFAEQNSEAVVKFLQGHLDKINLIERDAALAARTAFEQAEVYNLEIPASAFHIVFKRIDFSPEITNVILPAVKTTANTMRKAGYLEKIPVFSYNSRFLETAIEKKQHRESGLKRFYRFFIEK